jgi:hypothetical protein
MKGDSGISEALLVDWPVVVFPPDVARFPWILTLDKQGYFQSTTYPLRFCGGSSRSSLFLSQSQPLCLFGLFLCSFRVSSRLDGWIRQLFPLLVIS